MSGGGGGIAGGFGSGNREGLRLSLEGFGCNRLATNAVSPGTFNGLAASSSAGVPTLTTPTVTPTTLRNIEFEQMFFDSHEAGGGSGTLGSHPLHENAAHFVPPAIDNKDETCGGANDLSTPTIANVILDMSNGQDILNEPTTVESVVKQLQETEKSSNVDDGGGKTVTTCSTILNVPSFVISTGSSSTATSSLNLPNLDSSSMLLPSAKIKRRTLQSVISQLSPSLAKTPPSSEAPLPHAGGGLQTGNHVPAQIMPTPSRPFVAAHSAKCVPSERRTVEKPILLKSESNPLHSLASVSAIQKPLPVLPKAKESGNPLPEQDALNLSVGQLKKQPEASARPNAVQLLLNASVKSDETQGRKARIINRRKESKKTTLKRSYVTKEECGIDLTRLTDEERRKALRRQRNKEAAARCRKRRLDQTLSLEDQVQMWEDRKVQAQREIETLTLERVNLLALLEIHKCQALRTTATPSASGSSIRGNNGRNRKTKINNNEETNGENLLKADEDVGGVSTKKPT